MKIVFTASEAAPFIKTGGLGDVAEALPNSLSKIKGNEVILFLPYYEKVKNNPQICTELVSSFYVDLAWRKQYAGILKYKSRKKKLTVYFVDNEYYFKREKEYGHMDDGERFAFFCMAVMETMAAVNFFPDILHAHDWQAALSVIYLNRIYKKNPEYHGI